ncbi:BTAD domain-containing putative transcriptional regulator [Nocardia sp. NPDC019395]|uniref:BTAD domain-containing putative transcriptional regulator n=1 Tax=Nocardia sp. NPDC019395 TaxID=3154686 RepID=UPI0033E504B6
MRVLGPVRLFSDGHAVDLSGTKVRALLAVLVLNRGNPVTKTTLVEALWDDEPAGSVDNLYGYVSRLRAALRGSGADGVLRSVSGGYQLDIDAVQCDLGRFECALADGARARRADDFAGAARSLSAALQEWSGTALADLQELRFAANFAVRMGEHKRSAVADRIEADIAGGHAATVIGELRELTIEYPLDEQLWRLLITALYLTGRQAGALDACLRLRRSLRQEQGVDPDPRTVALEDAVRNQRPLTAGPSSPGATERDAPRLRRQAWMRSDGGLPIPIPPAGLAIGRDPSNDVVIGDDNRVSRKHARILPRDEGVFVRDRDSANGVYVNGTLIRADTLLCDGDVIQLGSTTFGFEYGDE